MANYVFEPITRRTAMCSNKQLDLYSLGVGIILYNDMVPINFFKRIIAKVHGNF